MVAWKIGAKARRISAVLLSLILAGLGHLAIGYRRRAVAWWGAHLLINTTMVVAAILGAPRVAWSAILVAATIQLLALIDTRHLEVVVAPYMPSAKLKLVLPPQRKAN